MEMDQVESESCAPDHVLAEKHYDAVSEPAAVRLWLRLLTSSLTIEKRVRRSLPDHFATTLPLFVVLAALDRRAAVMTLGDLSKELMALGGHRYALVSATDWPGHLNMEL